MWLGTGAWGTDPIGTLTMIKTLAFIWNEIGGHWRIFEQRAIMSDLCFKRITVVRRMRMAAG